MALKYKDEEEICGVKSTAKKGKDVSIAQTGAFDDSGILNKSVRELINSGKSPRQIAKQVEVWCQKLNAQTLVPNKNISKIKNKPYFSPVLDFLNENKLKEFSLRELVINMGIQKYSDGDAQRKVLASMVCFGIVKKYRLGKKDVFSWNEFITPCEYYKDDRCSWDWRNATETEFYKKT